MLHQALINNALPPSRWYMVVMEWVLARLVGARRKGLLTGGPGFEHLVLEKVRMHACRSRELACSSSTSRSRGAPGHVITGCMRALVVVRVLGLVHPGRCLPLPSHWLACMHPSDGLAGVRPALGVHVDPRPGELT